MAKADHEQLYGSLLQISSSYTDMLSSVNTELMNVLRRTEMTGFSDMIMQFSSALPEISVDTGGAGAALQIAAEQLKDAMPDPPIPPLTAFAESLDKLQLSADLTAFMGELQLSTASLLTQMPQTQLVIDLSECFEQARFDLMPSTFSSALMTDEIAVSDIALMRLSGLVPVMDEKIVYPRGLKTSLVAINKAAAKDLSRESQICYRTEDRSFHHGSASVEAKTLNLISAARATIADDEGELFTEEELIDFVSYLATTPMMGLACDVGGRIKDWLERMFQDGSNTVGFGKEVYYHCRKRLSTDMPYTWEEMKKAPHGLPWTGRYNLAGTAHFYFADTHKGAENEVQKYLTNGEVLQTARIVPCRDIAMLDLSHALSRGKTLLRMIRYPLSSTSTNSKFPREYLLPCFIAECCKLIGFDGIKYYGSKEHTNFVCWDDGYFRCVGMC